ncbi:MAG: phytoene desaturase family protein, partial [Actinomycetota bacterium]
MATNRYDAIVIGAGHNALVTAALLAKGGQRVVLLERRDRVGGLLDTVEIADGVKAPGLAHTVGRLRTSVADQLNLRRHGFEPIAPDVRVFAPQPNGRALTLWSDAARTAADLRAISAKDADAYPLFDRKVRSVASFLAYLNVATPPDVKNLGFADLLTGLRAGRAFRELGAKAGRETTRVLPMAVADLVAEMFESDAVKGAIASRAVQFVSMGPWSAGTAFVLLNDSAGNDGGAAGQTVFATGGPGALAEALASAARSFGAEIRTGAEVTSVVTREHRAVGVALASGEELSGRVVVSGADPKRTLSTLIDPVILGPELVWRAGNIRTPGVVSKVNLVLSGLPTFNGAEPERLRGRIVIAPSIDYLERGFDASKFGRISDEPYLEATIPTLSDPSLAPAGTHVMSVI